MTVLQESFFYLFLVAKDLLMYKLNLMKVKTLNVNNYITACKASNTVSNFYMKF